MHNSTPHNTVSRIICSLIECRMHFPYINYFLLHSNAMENANVLVVCNYTFYTFYLYYERIGLPKDKTAKQQRFLPTHIYTYTHTPTHQHIHIHIHVRIYTYTPTLERTHSRTHAQCDMLNQTYTRHTFKQNFCNFHFK